MPKPLESGRSALIAAVMWRSSAVKIRLQKIAIAVPKRNLFFRQSLEPTDIADIRAVARCQGRKMKSYSP